MQHFDRAGNTADLDLGLLLGDGRGVNHQGQGQQGGQQSGAAPQPGAQGAQPLRLEGAVALQLLGITLRVSAAPVVQVWHSHVPLGRSVVQISLSRQASGRLAAAQRNARPSGLKTTS